ncbi:MAG: TIGR03960 family B12-binding radical SAM protein [Chloroflexi bacterium]|nr:TIGR03960 family B12-binding radical SAM protein [Chloroflexota bacterium]
MDNSLDSLLRSVTRPARYTGGEWNSVAKPQARVRLVLAYPDVYEVGMSNLGLAILYDVVNSHPDYAAERVYTPWPDMAKAMRQARVPLFSLESRRPLGEFDVLGFSLGHELNYTNVLHMLDLAGIPLFAQERDQTHPLVIAGGSCALNPEPMSDFIDLFVLGEGEEVLLELLELCALGKEEGWSRRELLMRAAAIPGIYAPSLYEVTYHDDGAMASIVPTVPEAPAMVSRRWLAELPPALTCPVVPYLQVVHDRGAVELQRGCTRGCRFCQAGAIYRPLRRRAPEQVVEAAGQLMRGCGYQEIALLALSTSDYPGIETVVAALRDRYGEEHIRLSLPSLRLASFSVKLAESLQEQKKLGLTFAPEAGTYRLRQAINKTATEETILEALELALDRGWSSIKLYFMLGLPTETEEDVVGIADLVARISRLRSNGRRPNLRVSAAAFIPKAHTPFQWWPQDTQEVIEKKNQLLRRVLKPTGAALAWSNPQQSLLEAVLARGDRRLGQVVYRAWQRGCAFDSWREHFQYGHWHQALQDTGLAPAFYAHRERSLYEVLPWSHVDTGLRPAFLKREYERALRGEDTPDCAAGPCSACGLQRLSPACRERARCSPANTAVPIPSQGSGPVPFG